LWICKIRKISLFPGYNKKKILFYPKNFPSLKSVLRIFSDVKTSDISRAAGNYVWYNCRKFHYLTSLVLPLTFASRARAHDCSVFAFCREGHRNSKWIKRRRQCVPALMTALRCAVRRIAGDTRVVIKAENS